MERCSTFLSGNGNGMMGGFSRFGFGMSSFWLIALILLVVAVVYMLKGRNTQMVTPYSSGPTDSAPVNNKAMAILDEEFAKGNLTEAEYLEKKDVLGK